LAKGPFYLKASSREDLSNTCDKLKVTNCTFNDIDINGYVAVIDLRNNDGGSWTGNANELLVDHCTFYNIHGDYNRIVMSYKSANAVVSNCIFAQPTNNEFYPTYNYGGSVLNNLSFNTKSHRSGPTQTANITGDPKFKDAANGDFTLMEGSPALTAGPENSPIGDPRWVPAPAGKVLADGFYLLGKTGWDLDDVDSTLLFKVNPANDKEYILHILLAEKDSFKIVKVEDDGIVAWYPDQADNYVVDAKHAGEKDIYFRPDGQGGEGWYYGVFFVEPNPEPILGTHFVKVTEAPADWAGEYLIVFETADTLHASVAMNGGLAAFDAASNGVAVSIEDNKIAVSEALLAAKFTIAAMNGGYSIKGASGKFIGAASYANSLLSSDTAIANVLSIADNNAVIAVNVMNQGNPAQVTLRYNYAKDQLRFRYYKSGQQPVALYKLTTIAPEPTHTYTVAGAPAAVFGEEWNASYEENDMEFLANQSYMWIKDSVVLRAGTTVQFKVVEDHAWAKAWPEQNYQLAIPEDGYYSIIIAFNLAADPDSIVEAKAVKVGEIEPTVEHIFFTKACAKDSLASDAKFGSEIFNVTITDTDNKMEIDANNVFFGSDSIESVYNFRLKTGGKSSAKNFMTINIPEDGLLAIAVRTSSNADSTRTLVLVQGEDTLYNKVVKESDAVKYKINDSTTISLYPYVVVPVKAGQVTVTYPVGALNFYAFAFTNQIPEPTHTYTVAGAPATLFGKEWNASYAENDMESYGTDTYFWRRDSVALAAGNVEFKIVEDHSWSKGWPAQNYVLKIDSAGLYNITIMFKPKAADPDSMVSAIAYKVADAVVLPKIILHGEFTGSWADTEEFAIAEDNLTASLKLNLTAGSYKFGMKFDGVWKANGAELTREAPETSLLEGTGDMKITADVDGEYIFTYTFLGEKLAVTYPAAAPVAPTTAPAAPTAAEDDVLAIYCNHYTTNNLHFEILGWGGVTTWHADTIDGVAIVHCQDMKYEFLTNWGAASYDMSAYKKLHADLWAPAASTIRLGIEALGANDGGSGFKSGVVCTLAEGWNSIDIEFSQEPDLANYSFTDVKYIFFEWYKTPEGESFENNPFAFANIYFYDKESQAIDNIDTNTPAVKRIVNGMLIIEKNGKTYNVLGTLVK